MDEVDALRSFVRSPENRCFVCGPGNERGFHLQFDLRDGTVESSFVAEQWQQGWQGVVHGGALASVLDEAMAYVLFYRGVQAVTARLEVRFLEPAGEGDRLTVRAEIARDTRRLAYVEAAVRREARAIALASGTFVKIGPLSADSLRSAGLPR